MNSTKKLFIALLGGGLILSSSLMAQLPASEAGLLGKRYAGVDLTYDYFRSSNRMDDATGGALSYNMPVRPTTDVTFGYAGSSTDGNNFSASNHALTASLVTFNRTSYGKAYFGGTIGHAWDRTTYFGVRERDNSAIWGATAGFEVSVGEVTALNAGINYTDSFGGRDRQTILYRVEATHWLSAKAALVGSAGYKQIKSSPDAIAYTLGLRWAL